MMETSCAPMGSGVVTRTKCRGLMTAAFDILFLNTWESVVAQNFEDRIRYDVERLKNRRLAL